MVAVGVIAATLTVGGAGAAIAANPDSAAGKAVGSALDAVGVDWSGMPDGYTKEQYEAFWGAGYTHDDATALAELWGTGYTETKARAGQMILDGEELPVAPGSTPFSIMETSRPEAPEDAPAPAAAPADGAEGAAPATDAPPAVEYTPAQYDAFWDAGYTYDDALALAALWGTEIIETKARAGQALLDGQTLPVAPGSTVAGS
ncbi:hypothetical protein [Cellulomonas shaoxiangyii]|uniref:Uncharacterized protein n=1 Tax=Cellulomonas shaoxiangyii TaxID=2566013 RepID=A0A4P7SEL2_9CELL|nr:hypothetical protein [Cellulomonas shaoxiangyii]QCB92472.1 hypothetical protein E5225_01785 [Cellulomonas shaoxiangyii]TGY84976.1 hypothetical protein E5226_08865 [Cellulomonas shaoxiangyii]